MSFAVELRDALRLQNRDASIDSVHKIVINGLRELDPKIRPRQTGYFNHSWAPDFVVTWEKEAARERQLFLRFDVANGDFAREITLLGLDAPIFLGMSPEAPQEVSPAATKQVAEKIADTARELQTLVTDATAVSVFANEVAERKDAQTATRSVVRGGQGVVDNDAANEILGSYVRAVEVIDATGESEDIREALDKIEQYLTERNTLVFERDLRSRWIGAGGAPEDFPGKESWALAARTAQEVADLVEALLVQDENVPDVQWREIVSSVAANALGVAFKGRKAVRGGRVNDLVRVGAEIWNAEWLFAQDLPSTAMVDLNDWFLGSGYGLGLGLSNCEVFFSDDGRRFSQAKNTADLPRLSDRLDVLKDASVTGIGLATSQEDVAITLRESATHTLATLFEDLVTQQSQTWQSALITRMNIELVSSGASAEINFKTRKIRASRPISLRVAALLVARYVAAIPESELDALEKSLAPS
jgi:hypothetical protein